MNKKFDPRGKFIEKMPEFAFVQVLKDINDLNKFWSNTLEKFYEVYKNKLSENPNSNYTSIQQKNIDLLKKYFQSISKDKSTTYKHASDLISEQDIKNISKELPKELRMSLKRLGQKLINQDKYALYSKALTLWQMHHNKDYVFADVAQLLFYIKKSYQNSREYLDVHSRVYIEDKVKEYINKFVAEKTKKRFLYLISIDVNGLKTVNDYGVSKGHIDGNKFLLVFTHILQAGNTTRSLERSGINVQVAAQSGDEYLLLLNSPVDLSQMQILIEKLYLSEMLSVEKLTVMRRINRNNGTITDYKKEFGEIDIANIIDYTNEELRMIFKAKNVEVNPNQRFMVTSSFGWSSIDEALEKVHLESENNYFYMRKEVLNALFAISDHRAVVNKKAFKDHLKKINMMQLYTLLTLRSDLSEMAILQEENKYLRARLATANIKNL